MIRILFERPFRWNLKTSKAPNRFRTDPPNDLTFVRNVSETATQSFFPCTILRCNHSKHLCTLWIAPINARLVSFTHSHPHELQVFYAITMVGWHTRKKKMFLTLISQLGITTSPLNNWMSWKYNKQSLVCVTKNTTHCSLDVCACFFLPLRNDWLFSHCFSYIFCVRISTSCVEHIA